MEVSIFLETDLQSLSEGNWRVKKFGGENRASASIRIVCFLHAQNLILATHIEASTRRCYTRFSYTLKGHRVLAELQEGVNLFSPADRFELCERG
jgi:hypothetical protein